MPSKSWYREHRNWLRLLGYSPALWFLGFFLFSLIVGGFARGPLVQAKLSEELGKIPPPPQTQLVEHTSLNKLTFVIVHEEYSTSLTLKELRHYYDAELKEKDWWFLEKHTQSVYWTDLKYCKGNYTAILSYPGVYGNDLEYWREHSSIPNFEEVSSHYVFQGAYDLSLESGGDCVLMKGGGLRILSFDCSVFLLLASLSWIVFASLICRATQIMNDNELLQLWRDLHFKLKTGVWGTRVRSVIWLILAAMGTLLSSYKVVMYLFNWTLDALS